MLAGNEAFRSIPNADSHLVRLENYSLSHVSSLTRPLYSIGGRTTVNIDTNRRAK